MKIITSRDNPLFKKLRGLAQDGREIRKQGLTLLDGPHLVGTYRDRMGMPQELLVSEDGLQRAEIQALVDRHRPLVPIVLKDSLFRELSPTQTPVGILALIQVPLVEPGLPLADCVMLDALQDAGNVGTILRSAAAFGVKNVFLGNGCVGAWTPKVLRAGQGAHFSLRIQERCDLPSLLEEYRGSSLGTVVEQGESIYSLDLRPPIAWLIGNEGQGLSPALASACSRRVTIPIHSDSESLNAAVAASICLAEAARQRGIHG